MNYGKTIELSIILPSLGEGVCLEGMLKLLTIDIEMPYEIVFACDIGELDHALKERVDRKYPMVKWLEKTRNECTLETLKRGVQAADGQYILVLCADTAGPDLPIANMMNLIKADCDFVSTTRYAGGGQRLGGAFFEVMLSRSANYILHHFAGSVFTDCTTGLKLFRKNVFGQLSLQAKSSGWVTAFEMALKAQTAGLKLGEVATISVDRLYGGSSTCELGSEFLEYIKWFIWGLTMLHNAPTKHLFMPIKQI